MNAQPKQRFTRPLPSRHGPNRAAANFYRAAGDNPDTIGGIALDSVEAAATAAVRLGYRIAEAQIDRTTRIAQRMREAGDRATGGSTDSKRSDRKALDATEELIFKGLMAGLGFLEGAAADRGNPIRRLATAQFQLLGSLLGLTPDRDTSRGRRTEPPVDDDYDDAVDQTPKGVSPRAPKATRRPPQVKHAPRAGSGGRRAVRVTEWHLSSDAPPGSYPLMFYPEAPPATAFPGELGVTRSGATLTVKTSAKTRAGRYQAAICDDDGLQVGFIELTV
jgi:hypothetical protein